MFKSRTCIFGVYIFAAIILLTGCAPTGGSPTFLPPAGTEVQVNQELNARSGARLHVQNGEVLERRDVDVLYPYCVFRVTRSSTPLVIQRGTFTVTTSYRRLDYAWADGLLLAASSSNRSMTTTMELASDTLLMTSGSNRSMDTIMELSSDTQPEVSVLVCQRWGDRRLDGFLTIPEMQGTLGGLVTMTLPGPS